MRIFIAESQAHVCLALRLIFEQQGTFEIAGEAVNSESLLAQVCTSAPDLILLDWNLPGLRPYHLLQTLKRYCPQTQVVVTSVNPENQRAALADGADGFLLKSLAPDEFLQVLSAFLQSPAPKEAG